MKTMDPTLDKMLFRIAHHLRPMDWGQRVDWLHTVFGRDGRDLLELIVPRIKALENPPPRRAGLKNWFGTTLLFLLLLGTAVTPAQPNPHRKQVEEVVQIQGTVIAHHRNAILIDIPAPEPIDYRNMPGHNIGINVGGRGSSGPPYKRPPQGIRILFLHHPDWNSFQPGQKITLLGYPWPEKIRVNDGEYLAYRMLRPEEVPIIED